MAYSAILEFANNAKSTLAGAITSTGTAANLATGTGALFPVPGSGEGYVGTFVDAATGLLNEIVLVTQMSGDQIVVMVRAQEGTTALNWNAGDFFYQFCTAGTLGAMLQLQQSSPTRVVTSSAGFTLTNLDGAVGLARVTALAAQLITLPINPSNGQLITLEDLVGNFNSYPLTISPNAGQNISGEPGSVTLNINRQSAAFRFYAADNTWSFKP